MDYAPNVRFCEVLLNGVYQGLYVMTETVSSGADARLKLTEPSKDTVQTSYALRLDRGSGNEVKTSRPSPNTPCEICRIWTSSIREQNGLRRSARRGSHRISPTLKRHSTPMTIDTEPYASVGAGGHELFRGLLYPQRVYLQL